MATVKTYKDLAKQVELLSCFLLDSNCSILISPSNLQKLISEQKVSADNRFGHGIHRDEADIFSCVFQTKVTFFKKLNDAKKQDKKSSKNLGNIAVTFRATYKCKTLKTYTDKVLQEFCIKNATFNMYPFVRQYISYITQQFGVQPYILPLYLGSQETQKKAR